VFNQKLSYYLIHLIPLYIALFSVWVYHSWTTTDRMMVRGLIAAGVFGLVVLEAGGVAVRSARRSMVEAERKVVAFVKSHTAPDQPIVGTASLIYALDFDPRLIDDQYLGLRSGRTPRAIIIDEALYQTNYNGWMKSRPEDMKRILARLEEYDRVYTDGNYRVYLRKNVSAVKRIDAQ
jgi:hypothetical protein